MHRSHPYGMGGMWGMDGMGMGGIKGPMGGKGGMTMNFKGPFEGGMAPSRVAWPMDGMGMGCSRVALTA